MAVDYSIYDLKRSFTVNEAAWAYAQTEYAGDSVHPAYNTIRTEMMRDIKSGVLHHRIVRDIKENWLNYDSQYTDRTDWSQAEIERDNLCKWFEGNELKPKFLFKEMRMATEIAALPPLKAKEADPRRSKLDKARCQAIAQMLWEVNPAYTIADMIKDKRVLKFGNGSQYVEKTLHNWLKK